MGGNSYYDYYNEDEEDVSMAEARRDMTSGSVKKDKLTISIAKSRGENGSNQFEEEEDKDENSLGSMNDDLEEGEVE